MPDPAAALARDKIEAALWPPDAWSFMKTWAILDAARDERIYRAVDRSYQEKCCLFAGKISRQLREVAPYLIRFDKGDDLSDFVIENGWGNAWGIFFSSQASMETLRKHFRRFLRVTDESGRRLLFRYYDPRVLSIYLPTCNHEELTTIFGPIERFVVEAEEGAEAVGYRFSGVRLKAERVEFKSDGIPQD
jgi:Domain of unknown function (DUF4123)